MGRISATEAARRFSEVLNRVAEGEEFEITRAGAPVAVIARPRIRLLSPERFRDLLASAPPVDADFARDLRRIRREAGAAPESSWPS
jgi:prevent-host-death family protein